MAYSVDWVAKVITIPASDLTLVSGTTYSLSLLDFHKEIRRLESEFGEGLWAAQILDHTNPKTIAGDTYAAFDEIINGYTITFEAGVVERVNLTGSNNNIVDVLNVNGISVVPKNSAGLVIAGSGVTGQDKIDIAALVWEQVKALTVSKFLGLK